MSILMKHYPVAGLVVEALTLSDGWDSDQATIATARAKRADVSGVEKSAITRWRKGERPINLEQLRVLVGCTGPGHLARAQAVLRALAAELGVEVSFVAAGRVGTAAEEALDVDEAAGVFARAVHRDMADGRLDHVEEHHARLDALELQIAEARKALPPRTAR